MLGEGRVEQQVAIGGFECGVAGVDAGDLRADLREMQREAALIGADVECAPGAARGGDDPRGSGVVEALVEERAGLLAAGCVVAKVQAVEDELRKDGSGLVGVALGSSAEG